MLLLKRATISPPSLMWVGVFAIILVHLILLRRRIAAIPRAGIDEQLVAENEEVWIAGVSFLDAETVDLLPGHRVVAGQHDDR